MPSEESKDVLTLVQAGAVLELSPETIRRRIKQRKIIGRFDRDSAKLGYIIEREDLLRYLRSIGEHRRADKFEQEYMRTEEENNSTSVLN